MLHGELPQVSPRPFAVVADALRPILATDPDRFGDLAGSLAPIVDEDPPHDLTIGVDSADRRVRAFEAILSALARLSDGSPLLLVLEQIDQAGDSTFDLVEHLVRARARLPLVVVLTVSDATSRNGVHGRLSRAERDGSLRRLTASTPRVDEDARPGVAAEGGSHAMRALAALDVAVEHSARRGTRRWRDSATRRRWRTTAWRSACSTSAGRINGAAVPNCLLACGRACHVAYELTEALTMFRLAARSAVSIGDIALLNEAACGLAFATEFAMADSETVELLAHALRTVPSDSPRRVELLAGLARTMPQDDRRTRSHAATAVALARRLGDPRALTIALATWVLVSWGPSDPSSRLTMIDEVISLGEELAWADIVVEALNWRAATLLQLGRQVEAAADTVRVEEWARQTGRPFFVALAAMRHVGALLDERRLDEAETALSNPPVGAHSSPNFSEAAAAQLFLLRLAQGRVGRAARADRELPRRWPGAVRVAGRSRVGPRAHRRPPVGRCAAHPGCGAAHRAAQLAVAHRRDAPRRRVHRPRRSPERTDPRERVAETIAARPSSWPMASLRSARSPRGSTHCSHCTHSCGRITRKSQASRKRLASRATTTLETHLNQGDTQ